MALDLRLCDPEYSFIKERICNTEKHFSEIILKLTAYLKNLSQLQDSEDNLAKSVSSYASKESLNSTLRKCLMRFTEFFKATQKYRNAQIQRIDVKVVLKFDSYKPIFKLAKNELKTGFKLCMKETNLKIELEKTRANSPANWKKIAQAEKEACRVQDEATRTRLELSKRIDNFEQQKLLDIKNALMEFIKIELVFHAKTIEMYTSTYNSVMNINVDEDLEEFRSLIRSHANFNPDDANSDTSKYEAFKNDVHYSKSKTSFNDSMESKQKSYQMTSTPTKHYFTIP